MDLSTLVLRYSISGLPSPVIVFSVTIHLEILSSDGISYITSIIAFSIIERSPLAPVFLSRLFLAIALTASSVISNWTSSYSKSFLYCLTRAFLGSVMILQGHPHPTYQVPRLQEFVLQIQVLIRI